MITQTGSIIRGLLLRQQPGQPLVVVLKAGVGGLLAIGAVAWLSHVTGNLLLMAPFGATCVLLFSVPNSPLSQPANVKGLVGLLAKSYFESVTRSVIGL